MRIGSAWCKVSDKSGKTFLSISFDEAALPLTITDDKFVTLWEIPESERTDKEKSPHYSVSLSKSTKEEKE